MGQTSQLNKCMLTEACSHVAVSLCLDTDTDVNKEENIDLQTEICPLLVHLDGKYFYKMAVLRAGHLNNTSAASPSYVQIIF